MGVLELGRSGFRAAEQQLPSADPRSTLQAWNTYTVLKNGGPSVPIQGVAVCRNGASTYEFSPLRSLANAQRPHVHIQPLNGRGAHFGELGELLDDSLRISSKAHRGSVLMPELYVLSSNLYDREHGCGRLSEEKKVEMVFINGQQDGVFAFVRTTTTPIGCRYQRKEEHGAHGKVRQASSREVALVTSTIQAASRALHV